MLLCPLCCVINARNLPWYYSYLESSEFSYIPVSLVYKENITDSRGDIVDLGNRFGGITSTATNAGDVESSARKIAETADIEGNRHIHTGSGIQLSFVKECYPLY